MLEKRKKRLTRVYNKNRSRPILIRTMLCYRRSTAVWQQSSLTVAISAARRDVVM